MLHYQGSDTYEYHMLSGEVVTLTKDELEHLFSLAKEKEEFDLGECSKEVIIRKIRDLLDDLEDQ